MSSPRLAQLQPRRDRASRRQFLRCSTLAATTFSLANVLRLQECAAASTPATADSCILIFLNGGMSHIDTFDPKPNAPSGIRGEFGTIATSAPEVQVTEHLTRMARQAHRYAVVRSVGFRGLLGNHSPACYHMLTGKEPTGDDAVLAPPRPTDHPSMGSVAARFRPVPGALPAYVMVPDVLIENVFLTPGQFAGWLGAPYEAFLVRSDPSAPDYSVPDLAYCDGLSAGRIAARRALRERLPLRRRDLGSTPAGRNIDPYYQRAFDMLTGTRAQKAFDISAEPPRDRDRYGLTALPEALGLRKFGQSVLLARRLVEAGVRFVNVHWPNVGGGQNWDTHGNGFNRLKDQLLPPLDMAVSALLEDLAERGLLERTLVVVMTEFGRAPYIGKTFQNNGSPAGRDHWSDCFTILLAGGGLCGGYVHGRSDRDGAYPAERHLRPADVVATLYQALGIDPDAVLTDPSGRDIQLCDGTPVSELFV